MGIKLKHDVYFQLGNGKKIIFNQEDAVQLFTAMIVEFMLDEKGRNKVFAPVNFVSNRVETMMRTYEELKEEMTPETKDKFHNEILQLLKDDNTYVVSWDEYAELKKHKKL